MKKLCSFFLENEKICSFFSQEILPFFLTYVLLGLKANNRFVTMTQTLEKNNREDMQLDN